MSIKAVIALTLGLAPAPQTVDATSKIGRLLSMDRLYHAGVGKQFALFRTPKYYLDDIGGVNEHPEHS